MYLAAGCIALQGTGLFLARERCEGTTKGGWLGACAGGLSQGLVPRSQQLRLVVVGLSDGAYLHRVCVGVFACNAAAGG